MNLHALHKPEPKLKAMRFKINMLLLIFPSVIGLLMFASYVIYDNWKIVNNVAHINHLIQLSVINNALVHELQVERAFSNAYLSSNGKKFHFELVKQRVQTNGIARQYRNFFQKQALQPTGQNKKNKQQNNPKLLSELASIRISIDKLTITNQALLNYYATLNSELITIITPTIQLTHKENLSTLLQAYFNLVQGKEYAAIEWAALAKLFNGKKVSKTDRKLYNNLITAQKINLSAFVTLSDWTTRQMYQQQINAQSQIMTDNIRSMVLKKSPELNNDTEKKIWFEQAGIRLSQLKATENNVVKHLHQLIDKSSSYSKDTLTFSLIYSVIALILSIILYKYVAKVIRLQKQEHEQLHKFKLIVDNCPHSVIITSLDNTVEYCNQQGLEMTGFDQETILGQKPRQWLAEQASNMTYDDIIATTATGNTWQGELLNKHQKGQLYWARTSIFPVTSPQGEICSFIAIQEDVTQRKKDQEKIRFLANHDSLTGLPSLRLGMDRLEQAILAATRHNLTMALMFIDLDGFKDINDQFGHMAGDAVLIEVGQRMIFATRDTDTITRIGGDEFMVVLTNVRKPEAIDKVADKILARLKEPFYFQNNELSIGASIGIALCPQHGNTSSVLLQKADEAMYQVKQSGKNSFAYSKTDNC